MQRLREPASIRTRVHAWKGSGERVALVPTMGAIHAGHLSLVDAARAHADRVIVSLFVNPLQFGAADDLARYPRDEDGDARLLAEAGVDVLFAPEVAAIYPPGFQTGVRAGALAASMEGAARPGHFDGVATIVLKLLLIAAPDLALFGEKDWQQLAIIRRMVADLDVPVAILAVPTLREADGLAMSSRNRRLAAGERQRAAEFPAVLQDLAGALSSGTVAEEALAGGRARLAAAGFAVEYLQLADGETLAPMAAAGPGARLFAAIRLGDTRLIDNLPVPAAPHAG